MVRAAHTGILPLLLLASCLPVRGIDFPDQSDIPFREEEVSAISGKTALLPRISGSLSYESVITRDDTQVFNLRCGIYGTAVQYDTIGLGFFFDSILLAGPVKGTETPASAAEFWLNAVQYEYGIESRIRLEDWDLSAGYSRSSLHPLRAGFAETAYDVLKAGAVLPAVRTGGILARFSLHGGYHTLFDFWKSRLPRYRVQYSLAPRIYLETRTPSTVYARFEPTLFFLGSGDAGYDVFCETGLQLNGTGGAASFYLWFRFCDDTELLAESRDRCAVTGLGVRISTSP